MKKQEIREKVLFILTLVTLLSAGVSGYIFFKNPDSIFGPLFVLSGIVLGILTNLWCSVWGFEISEDEEDVILVDYDPDCLHSRLLVRLGREAGVAF